LATPEATLGDLSGALAFVTDRVGNWIRTGEFALAREAMALAAGLCGHAEPSVAKPAQALVSASVNADDLIEGARHRAGGAAGAPRVASVHVVFRRDCRWTLPLIDRLLRDDEAEIRRLAVMKLVSDADLATAGNVLAAASKKGKYEADVALGLAELLRHVRHHPDVRPGWRTWVWSKRWWSALLFVNIG